MKSIKLLFFSLYLLLVNNTYAANEIGLDESKQPGGIMTRGKTADALLEAVFRNTLTILFTVGALGFIIIFIWGAVDWILSGGDKEKIAGARKRIVTAITGLVLLALTFVITIIIGQVLGLCTLRNFDFPIPQLINPNNELCKQP